MAGHSKWANIKRRKGVVDAKRGKVFTKLVREITTAVRVGQSGDPGANPRLRLAIAAAKSESMPGDNIERAIKKGLGASDGGSIEEVTYEGYGAGGVAFLVVAQTDNRNRTGPEVRAAFSKNGGNLGQSGSVGWMFSKRGELRIDADEFSEEAVIGIALEAGAEDVRREGGEFVVETDPTDFARVLDGFEASGVGYLRAELVMVPENLVRVVGKDAVCVLRLMERLEDLDDVQSVYANFDIDDEELEKIAS